MTFTSPFGTRPIPSCEVVDHVLGDVATEDLTRNAVLDAAQDIELTYAELTSRIHEFAAQLTASGVGLGDVVALLAPNGAAFVVAFHAMLRSGATVTPINTLYRPKEIAAQLSDSRAVRIITVPEMQETALTAAAAADLAADQVTVVRTDDFKRSTTPGCLSTMTVPRLDPAVALACLPYSSGTTGKAKGVMLTHRNIVANLVQCEPVLDLRRDDVVLAVLPFFHIYGLNVLMNLSLRVRASLITMARFDLEEFLRLIEERQCTYLFIAPPMAVALAKHPLVEQFDLSSVRTIVSGAAPLDADLGEAVKKRLGCALYQGYGMTELSPVSHVIPPGRPYLSLGSIGLPLPNVEFKVIDPASGMELEQVPGDSNGQGEMWIRGPMVMSGYLNNDEATRETIDEDGFLHTGDIVRVGAHGEVYVVDRLKELIKYKGYQVPPAELEAVLLTHSSIADAAVVPSPDPVAGEVPHAFVVLLAGATLNAEEVMDFVARQVAPHKKVRGVHFCSEIPKSAAGKILRKELRALLEAPAE